MDSIGINLLFLLSRYLHIVATALLVGGILFYELIVPTAIADLKDEQKLAVFARARWAFRGIVYLSAIILLVTGAISTYRNWYGYTDATMLPDLAQHTNHLQGAGYWWAAHALLTLVGIVAAVAMVSGRAPPRNSLLWMRIILLILLTGIFMASTARHVRLRLIEHDIPTPMQPAIE